MAAASKAVLSAREHLSCIRCRCLTLLCAFQEGERALDTWRSTVESVHSDVGYAPAMAMLSAYGFYNGQTRNDPGGGPAAQTGDLSMPCCVLTCILTSLMRCYAALYLLCRTWGRSAACICSLTFVLQEAEMLLQDCTMHIKCTTSSSRLDRRQIPMVLPMMW